MPMRLPARKKTIPRTMGPVMASPSTAQGHQRGQDGFEEEHQAAVGGAGLLNGEHVEHIAQAGAHDADEQEVGQALEIDPLEQGDVLEHIQPHRPVEGRHRAGVA